MNTSIEFKIRQAIESVLSNGYVLTAGKWADPQSKKCCPLEAIRIVYQGEPMDILQVSGLWTGSFIAGFDGNLHPGMDWGAFDLGVRLRLEYFNVK